MMETLTGYLQTHSIELLGFLFGIIYVVLAIRENPWCWVAGIVNAGLYVWVFFKSRFYGAAGLQGIYLLMSVYGWFFWLGIGKKKEQAAPVVTHTPARGWPLLIALIAGGSVLFGALFSHTDNPIPWWDGITTAMGLVATWMAARKYLENWLVWIVNDTLCTIIYASQGLYPTMALYLVLGIMAVVGYLHWRKNLISRIP
ncbi:MAG TPA: nicotinamide riboside transporter PnuC [Bacteroidales bacterium]|nr:nicotinamide riboside transporter PnuC [Bacteroidales bacterium]HRZ48342.1 nicotinamide riboside transporter PnuC [Bacteroidales bacterium]